MQCVKKMDICGDFGYMYSLNWHLITTFQKGNTFWCALTNIQAKKLVFKNVLSISFNTRRDSGGLKD